MTNALTFISLLLFVFAPRDLCHVRAFIMPKASGRNHIILGIKKSKDIDEEFVKSLQNVGKDDNAPKFFTGGAFDNVDEQAAELASRITSIQALGWNTPPRRRGAARPRHRAYGGQTEKPIQDKPGYDESSPQCVEKWLTQEIFYEKVKDSSPAADAVFCALAGGAAFAERENVEQRLQEWRTPKFQKEAFYKSLKKGRIDLAIGWTLFGSANAVLLLCIVFPTNPIATTVEGLLRQFLQWYAAL